MFQINTSQANDSGDFIAIDDVAIVGEGLPIVTPEEIILPELIQDPPIDIPPIDIPVIDNPEIIETNQPEILAPNTQNKGIFTLPENKNLKFSLDSAATKNVSEIGLFIVDDENGNINGIAPDSENYLQAALQRSQVIFSTISNPKGFNLKEIQRILELDSQRQFGFYIIPNGSTEAIAENSTVLFSNTSQMQVNNLNQNSFNLKLSEISLNVEFSADTPATGTKLQAQKELIDLRDEVGSISVNIEVYREAEYDNVIGFYQVADADGGIDLDGDGIADINAGEQGYKEAALNNRITTIDLLATENQQTASYDGILEGGSLISTFIIVDATLEDAVNGEAEVLFSQLGANTDNVDSVRMLGDNIFGFEDAGIAGDFDYNDTIVKMDFGV